MKRILTNNIQENVRRQPFTKASYDHIQEAFNEVLTSILKNFTEDTVGYYRLHGLVDQDAGADYDISAGAVYFNGEVYQVDAFVAVAVGGQVPVLTIETTYHEDDPVTFSDNNNYNVHEIKKMVISLAASGSGDVDLDDLQSIGLPAEAAARIGTDALKANKAQMAWTDIVLSNGWAAFGGITPQYRVDEFGQVHLRGQLDASGSSSAVISAAGIPAPSNGATHQFITVLGNGSDIAKLSVDADGDLAVLAADYNVANRYRLEQIKYWSN